MTGTSIGTGSLGNRFFGLKAALALIATLFMRTLAIFSPRRWFSPNSKAATERDALLLQRIALLEAANSRLVIANDELRRAPNRQPSPNHDAATLPQDEHPSIMLRGIVHDLNNILTSVVGYTELALLTLPHDSVVHEYLTPALENARRAGELSQQMLTSARNGHQVAKPISLNNLVRETVDLMLQPALRHITVMYQFVDGLPVVACDPTQLRRTVLNLVANAAEAIGSQLGTIMLTTRLEWFDPQRAHGLVIGHDVPEGWYVNLQVRDTGCGMDRQTLEQIFEPFFTTKRDGHGLGLESVRGTIAQAGGALGVQSVPLQGTTFHIWLRPATGALAGAVPDL